MTVLVIRGLYCAAVVIGLLINAAEYWHWRRFCRQLLYRGVNGRRLLMARALRRSLGSLCLVQCCLLLAATLGWIGSVRSPTPIPAAARGFVVLAALAHVLAVIFLALNAIDRRVDRLEISRVG